MKKQTAEQEQKPCRAFVSTLLLGIFVIGIQPFPLSRWQALYFSMYGYVYVSFFSFFLSQSTLSKERVANESKNCHWNAKEHTPSYLSLISMIFLGYFKIQTKIR